MVYEQTLILLVVMIFGIAISFIAYNYTKNDIEIKKIQARIEEKQEKHKYKLQKLKYSQEIDDNDEDDYDDDGIPPALMGILEGANINISRLKKGDTDELLKLQNVISTFLDAKKGNIPSNEGLI